MLVNQNLGLVATLRKQVEAGQISSEVVDGHLVVARPNGDQLCLECNSRAIDGELQRIGCE